MITLVLPTVPLGLLTPFFPDNPLHIQIAHGPTGLRDALPKLFAALGMDLPTDWQAATPVAAPPVHAPQPVRSALATGALPVREDNAGCACRSDSGRVARAQPPIDQGTFATG